jgi:hypothetical protein
MIRSTGSSSMYKLTKSYISNFFSASCMIIIELRRLNKIQPLKVCLITRKHKIDQDPPIEGVSCNVLKLAPPSSQRLTSPCNTAVSTATTQTLITHLTSSTYTVLQLTEISPKTSPTAFLCFCRLVNFV